MEDKSKEVDVNVDVASSEAQVIPSGAMQLQRKLGGKEVQLFAIGGAIGTSEFSDQIISCYSLTYNVQVSS